MILRDLEAAVLEVDRSEGETSARCRYPADLAVLDGHFPTYRVLPGVYGIQLALHLLDRAGGPAAAPYRILRAKFARPVFSGMRFTVEIAHETDAGGLTMAKVVLREEGGERALLSRFTLRLGGEE